MSIKSEPHAGNLCNLQDRVAVVTGSSRGIGFEIARVLASQGCNIVLNGVSNESAIEAAAETLRQDYGVDVLCCFGDVSDASVTADMAKAVFKKFKRLDVLVNNAGILDDGLLGMMTQDQINRTLDINVKGPINTMQAFSRLLARSPSGSIINISSIIGREGNRGQVVYGASKAAVIGATYSAAKELAAQNIRVNSIAPGYIKTDMISAVPEDTHQERLDSIAMKRIGQAEDVARTALFLASDLSLYVTGQVIGVDGGMLI